MQDQFQFLYIISRIRYKILKFWDVKFLKNCEILVYIRHNLEEIIFAVPFNNIYFLYIFKIF